MSSKIITRTLSVLSTPMVAGGCGSISLRLRLRVFGFLLTSVYSPTGKPPSLVAGFLFAVVITEQSVFTAMFSSGMAVMLLIVCLQDLKSISGQKKPDIQDKTLL